MEIAVRSKLDLLAERSSASSSAARDASPAFQLRKLNEDTKSQLCIYQPNSGGGAEIQESQTQDWPPQYVDARKRSFSRIAP